jgi:oxalate decarboxylase/phosphoglucose isomerase-like protein (cupin superfamily)
LRSEAWQAIGRQLETIDLHGRSDEAQTWIRGVAAMLVQSDD